jgi:hypothetical protein
LHVLEELWDMCQLDSSEDTTSDTSSQHEDSEALSIFYCATTGI